MSSYHDTRKLSLFSLLMVGFIDHMGVGLVYPIFAVLLFDTEAKILPADTSAATRGLLLGLLIALTPLIQFFSSPILGALSDVKGRKKILQFGLVMAISGYMLACVGILADSLVLLLLYRVLVGFSDGTVAVAQAALADLSTEENKARNFSLFSMALGTGFTLGPFFGGKLCDPHVSVWCGYLTPFAFAGVLSLLNLSLVWSKFPETRVIIKEVQFKMLEAFHNLAKAFRWPQMRILFMSTFFYLFGWAFYCEFAPLYLIDRFHFSSSQVGDYYAYTGFWYAISSGVLTAPIIKRFTPEQIFSVSLVGVGAYLYLLLLVDNPMYIWVHIPVLMYFAALIYPVATTLVSNMADQDSQGEVLGVFTSVVAFAVGISPLLAGSYVAGDSTRAVSGGAIAMLLGGAVYVIGRRLARPVRVEG
jgi:DHA1 family tetracycline resistance protein-like MFS transporter